MSGNLALGPSFGVSNVIVPKGGPKAVPALLDFSTEATVEIDGSQIVTMGKIEYLQGAYIDNGDNANPLSITMMGTGQRITAPAHSQGYYNFLMPNPPHMVADTVPGIKVPVFFYNVPIQAAVWLVA